MDQHFVFGDANGKVSVSIKYQLMSFAYMNVLEIIEVRENARA